MADVSDAPVTGRAPQRVGTLFQYTGAALSVALVLGVGVWGYRLFIRDATGVPVVTAMEGPMRLAPSDPGGEVALNVGLSVNAVVARGTAPPPEDVFVLAPVSNGLAPEDMEMESMAEAGEVVPEDVNPSVSELTEPLGEDGIEQVALVVPEGTVVIDPLAGAVMALADGTEPTVGDPLAAASDTPLTADQVLALADQIAAGAEPLAPLAAGAEARVALAVDGQTVAEVSPDVSIEATVYATVSAVEALAMAEDGDPAVPVLDENLAADIVVIAASVPGVSVALRPPVRPMSTSAATQVSASSLATVGPLVSTEEITAGTSLVQLGPFETPELAAEHWDILNQRFAEFVVGKTRLIQQAESGGRVFYRLRAMGFTDLDDARRFCAVLVAENATCIPVVVQ
jgi:hypothetical protein